MPTPDSSFSATLRQLRKARRLSQLELSLRLGVSQRHVSFVESDRAKPSRELLTHWLTELNAPAILRNEAMLQAGYAPNYGTPNLNEAGLEQAERQQAERQQAQQALQQLLATHDPMPALVIDAHWNLVQLNRGGQWLAETLMSGMPGPMDLAGGKAINLLDLLVHPQGVTQAILNLEEVGPAFLIRLRRDASLQPELTPRVKAFEQLLCDRLGITSLPSSQSSSAELVMKARYLTSHGELSFFSMFSTFGTLQDISLTSLRVEHMFAADEPTRAVLNEQVA